MKKNWLIQTLVFLLLFSCGGEEFSPLADKDEIQTQNRITFSSEQCANFTLVRPKVDFLFIWDNSGSSFFINSQTQQALRNTINLMSGRFDYRITLAPLYDNNPGNPTLFVMTYNGEGLSSRGLSYVIPNDFESRLSAFDGLQQGVTGNVEEGFSRATSLIQNNISHGLFRQESHLFVVLMSNGDDNSYLNMPQGGTPPEQQQNFTNHKNTFLSLANNLNSNMLRFISLVAFSNNSGVCDQTFKIGSRYIQMSRELYINSGAEDQTGRAPYQDSFNICTADFLNLFGNENDEQSGPNGSIKAVLKAHVYDHWPIATTTDPTFDPGSLTVSKRFENGSVTPILESPTNGYSYVGLQNNRNTRVEPTPGEPFTGYMLRLNGNAKVTYPECLIVKTLSPADYYGFVALDREPNLDRTEVKINGEVIPQSAINGWEYIGFFQSKNIKIKSPQEPNQPGLPALNQTGYFLKMNGNAIYTNSTTVEVNYIPAINN